MPVIASNNLDSLLAIAESDDVEIAVDLSLEACFSAHSVELRLSWSAGHALATLRSGGAPEKTVTIAEDAARSWSRRLATLLLASDHGPAKRVSTTRLSGSARWSDRRHEKGGTASWATSEPSPEACAELARSRPEIADRLPKRPDVTFQVHELVTALDPELAPLVFRAG